MHPKPQDTIVEVVAKLQQAAAIASEYDDDASVTIYETIVRALELLGVKE